MRAAAAWVSSFVDEDLGLEVPKTMTTYFTLESEIVAPGAASRARGEGAALGAARHGRFRRFRVRADEAVK